jgi:glycosyltransferase involved in cell wall biosynthesis
LPDRPQLTVALPTYNGARYIADALEGILAQEGAAFELLVSDDQSSDATLEIARAIAGDRARIAVNPERLGLAGNWNRCIELSQTPWVAIFHQDDVMRPGHLSSHLRALQTQPEGGFVASAADVIGSDGAPVSSRVVARGGLGPVDRLFPPEALLPELAVSNPLRCSSVTIRKNAHADVGGFDASYRYVVDWDFWIRVARRWPVIWLAAPTVAIRWHGASETHRFKTGTADLDESIRLLDALYARDGQNFPSARKLRHSADRRLARGFLNRAYDASRSGDRSLVRVCLARAYRLAPGAVLQSLLDPRLVARIAQGLLAPTPYGERREQSSGQ